MKSRSRGVRVAVLILVPMFLLVTFGILFWKPVLIHVGVWATEWDFRACHGAEKRYTVIKANEDWAVQFGGTAGLGALERLQQNPNVSAPGRHIAVRIAGMIRKGGHLEYLRYMVEEGLPNGLMVERAAYILERDSP